MRYYYTSVLSQEILWNTSINSRCSKQLTYNIFGLSCSSTSIILPCLLCCCFFCHRRTRYFFWTYDIRVPTCVGICCILVSQLSLEDEAKISLSSLRSPPGR
ncbi:unnamed protein product [Amoebophrya sp. A120]|nr:unnamed protein product [Amoebophrya sp. A120]|eukprot:GSA120T00006730001.1